MFDKWIAVPLAQLGMIFLSSFVVYTAILLYTGMVGCAAFQKCLRAILR